MRGSPQRRRTRSQPKPLRARLSMLGIFRRYAYLSARGLTVICSSLPGVVFAAPFGSPGWFAQNNVGAAQTVGGRAPVPGLPGTPMPGAVTTPTQAIQQASRSIADLSRAAAAITAAQGAQNAARQFALGQPNPAGVADGLAPGGLTYDEARARADLANEAGCAPTNRCTWLNVELPTQAVDAATNIHSVTIAQNDQRALLTWNSFNVGHNTTVHFDQRAGTQSDGSNDWVALNRVTASTAPSQILGKVQAEGSVYVINSAGIIFGGASQVNTHSFLATTLSPAPNGSLQTSELSSNGTFLTDGIFGGNTDLVPLVDARFQIIPSGDIRIDAGASIRTQADGFSLIAAPNVSNAGQILADDGAAVLAAGTNLAIRGAGERLPLDVAVLGSVQADGRPTLPPGTLTNTGLIQARRGTVQLVGSDVILGAAPVPGTGLTQASTIVATTSVTRPGEIKVVAESAREGVGYNGVVRMDAGAVLALLPDANGDTTTSSTLADAAFTRGMIGLQGGSVRLMGDALIAAPGQNVSLTATAQRFNPNFAPLPAPTDGSVAGRVFLDAGATIDVAGLANIERPISINFVSVPRLGLNELADSPLQRDGALFRAPVIVDRRRRGLRGDGTTWFGTSIANVNGSIDLVPRTVDQLLSNSGDIELSGTEVLTRTGSMLNLDAGFIHYLGGEIPVTRLVAANGSVVDLADADPFQDYVGFAGTYEVEHARFNLTDTYVNPVLASGGFESAYIEGGRAGTLSISLSGSFAGDYRPVGFTQILNGAVSARAWSGRYQVADGRIPAGGSFRLGRGGSLDNAVTGDGLSYVIRDALPQLDDIAAAFSFGSALPTPDPSIRDPWNHPELPTYWTTVSGSLLEQAGFSSVNLVTAGVINVEDALSVRAGGAIDLRASVVNIGADLRAPAGRISVTSFGQTGNAGLGTNQFLTTQSIFVSAGDAVGAELRGDIRVMSGVTLSTRGLWVNDSGLDADNLTGDAFVDGGPIRLVAWAASGQSLLSGRRDDRVTPPYSALLDLSGSVLLEEGSVLDVSGGGRILPNGRAVQSDGVLQGRGGDLTLETYSRLRLPNLAFVPPPSDLPANANIRMDGTVLSQGFSGGGTLRLGADRIGVSPDSTNAAPGTLVLAPEFFSGQGFSTYVLDAIGHEGYVDPGVRVEPIQSNLLPNLDALMAAPTGADILADGLTSAGTLDAFHRQATGFSLFARGSASVGEGALIRTDAGASVILGGREGVVVEGAVMAPGGKISLSADQGEGGYLALPDIAPNTLPAFATAIQLGAESLLDVSGTVIYNEAQLPVVVNGQAIVPNTGRVHSGGTVTLSNDNGYVVALACSDIGGCDDPAAVGARIDVSAAEAQVDVRNPLTGAFESRSLWGDAGTLRIGATEGLFFDGEIDGHAAGQGRGGTLAILPITNTGAVGAAPGLLIANTPQALPSGATVPGGLISCTDPCVPGQLNFSSDRVADSGLDSLFLGWDPGHIAASPVAVRFGANLVLTAARAIDINAAGFSAESAGDGSSSVRLAAAYVGLHGYGFDGFVSMAPSSSEISLSVDAQAIDLGGRLVFNDFGRVSIASAGDIRLQPDLANIGARSGLLYLTGDLSLSAAQLYPASNTAFAIVAGGDSSTIRFLGNERSATASPPLSVGGTLAVNAVNIVQSGVLRAPAGDIVLGVSDLDNAEERAAFRYLFEDDDGRRTPTLPIVATQTVTLTPDAMSGNISLTSVSLEGLVVPLGQTVDGIDLLVRDDGAPLLAPPDKLIALNAADLNLSAGARLDLSGGGTVQAREFVAGTGGSLDVLSQYNEDLTSGRRDTYRPLYQDARGVYAILPGYASALGAFDNDLVPYASVTSISPTVDPMVGRSVFLSGVPGLPPGVYTLLPGQYATLPGALRVVQDTRAVNVAEGASLLADGSYAVSGHFVDAFSGARSSLETSFSVQSESVWRQYSEYLLTDADRFFTDQAARQHTVAPQLLRDAGQLVLAATRSIVLGADLDAAPASSGIGARVDITAPRLAVTGSTATPIEAREGFVQIDASNLNALGASSLLLGGTRSRSSGGDLIRPVSGQLLVDNGSSTLRAPEILLTASGVSLDSGFEPGIFLRDGATIAAAGTVDEAAGVPITIGRLPDDRGRGALSGDGALLRVSNGGPVLVQRVNVTGLDGPDGVAAGTLQVDAGSSIATERGAGLDGGSILLDSTGTTTFAPSAVFDAADIEANSTRITLVAEGNAVPDVAGLVLSPELVSLLAAAGDVTLRSRSELAFIGDVDLALTGGLRLGAGLFSSDGGAVQLSADRLVLDNALGVVTTGADTGTGSLNLSGRELVFGQGSMALAGFSSVDALASTPTATGPARILLQGSGAFDFGETAVSLVTPLLEADKGANKILRAGGLLQVVGAPTTGISAVSAAAPLGGSLRLVGSSLEIDTQVQALGGTIDLRTLAGDLVLGDDARLSVQGVAKPFFDIVEYGSGGSVRLSAVNGDIDQSAGGVIDVSAPQAGGDAGTLVIAARDGAVRLDGSLLGGAMKGVGGSFEVDSAAALDLDQLVVQLTDGGFDGSIAVRSRSGNLELSAGNSLRAQQVELVADGGTLPSVSDGNVIVNGIIDASGERGGSIQLYGRSGVDLAGALDASSSAAGQRGGTVTLGTSGYGDGTYDTAHGYQNVRAERSGTLRLRDSARIDVSGVDEANELPGGRVHLRAPLLSDGYVNVGIDAGARAGIVGARDVSLEAYALWNASDDAAITGGARHFDGIIDPAGRFDADGNRLASGTNADHRAFYGETLLGFVREPGFAFDADFEGIANFHARPGIDLVNDDGLINDGDVRVLSHWNLGAGTRRADRSLDLRYRYQGMAPVLSLRAVGDAVFAASLSDGFFQYNNPFADRIARSNVILPFDSDNANGISPESTQGTPLPLLAMGLAVHADNFGRVLATYDSTSYRIVGGAAAHSVDPLGVSGSTGDVLLGGREEATVFNDTRPSVRESRRIVAPTMIRTGTGSIDVVAADDIRLTDRIAPGVIYTAGRPDADAVTGTAATVIYSRDPSGGQRTGIPWIVDTGQNHPIGAGDLGLHAGGDIVGVRGVLDSNGGRTGRTSRPTNIDQYWWPWMQGLCATLQSESCFTTTADAEYGIINFAAFGQGILSAGGRVSVNAGRDIVDLSVSLPTTYLKNVDAAGNETLEVLGGGDLDVTAGRDILSGDYFVSRGTARILAGGRVAASGNALDADGGSVSTLLALQDAQVLIRARQDLNLGDVLNPSYQAAVEVFDAQAFGVDSSLRVESLSGDVAVSRVTDQGFYSYGARAGFILATEILPATFEVSALSGSIDFSPGNSTGLFASPTGQFSLVAEDSVRFRGVGTFGLFDVDPARMRTPLNTRGLASFSNEIARSRNLHEPLALHRADAEPFRIYSSSGDILSPDIGLNTPFSLVPNKRAYLRAGRDIVDLAFVGQHLYASDLSLIQAGRDLYWNPANRVSVVQIGGPGTLEISAGRNLGPLLPSGGLASGFLSVGNQYNAYLDRAGANLLIEFGVAPGVAAADFAAKYISPQRTVDDVPGYTDELIAFVQQIQVDEATRTGATPPPPLAADQAWAAFLALSQDQQEPLVYRVLYDILDTVGLDYNRPSSPFLGQYGRGYAALATLFPSDLGYSENRLDGTRNGSVNPIATGNFDMRDATVQTQVGGDISIVGPGGTVLVGSSASPPFQLDVFGNVEIGPNKLGILALQAGAIRTFTDQDVLLAQSRIFTQQGGDLLMWSSNGDINAGKGAKTNTELPRVAYDCSGPDHFCVVDSTSQVSGAGIAALQTLPGEKGGDVNLIAPAGTVDAGEAGIRVSGDLNIAAAIVANADNVQVQGAAVGVPTGSVDSGALGAASAAAAAAAQSAAEVASAAGTPQPASTMIRGEVIGYGSMTEEDKEKLREKEKRKEKQKSE